MEVLSVILYVLFWTIAILLTGIVLVQEGRGGGLGQAFGGTGGDIFGHGAGGANKATFGLGGALFVVTFAIAWITSAG
jgi:preprotein translocase subunit SecG